MKYIYTFLFFLTSFAVAQAQEYTSNFAFRSKVFKVKSKLTAANAFEIEIEESDANKSSFALKPMKLETFLVAFETKLAVVDAGAAFTIPEKTAIKAEAQRIFYSIIAESLSENLSDAPASGRLSINKSIDVYEGSNSEADPAKGKLIVTDVEIEFSEGYIETIKVNGSYTPTGGGNATDVRFENIFGIGFSTRKNYKRLKNQALFIAEFDDNRYIRLGELLAYDYRVRSKTRDFSPGNQVLYSFGGEKVELKKEESSKILEMIIYADFLGIDQDNANGLIQTELTKRINLYPSRLQTWKGFRWLGTAFGSFQFIRPAVTISKIEENKRRLILDSNDRVLEDVNGDDSLVVSTKVSPLNVFYHQNLSLGLDLNIFFLDNPEMKYNFYLNGGFRFGRTAMRDSLRTLNDDGEIVKNTRVNDFGVSSFTWFSEASLHFMPEERFGIVVSDRAQYFVSSFGTPEMVTVNKEGFQNKKLNKWINTFEIMGYVQTGKSGSLFARWRYNVQMGNGYQNFHQVQVGYSVYLLKKN